MKLSGFEVTGCLKVDRGLFRVEDNSSLIVENMAFTHLKSNSNTS